MNDAFDFRVEQSRDAFEDLKCQAQDPTDFLKMDRLRFHLRDKRELKGNALRCLVFAQQRITTLILSHYINTDPELQRLGLKADFVAARNSNIAPGISVTRGRASEAIQDFRSGTVNVLVATSVLEEVCLQICGQVLRRV